jgi:hypothetical protein
MTARVVLGLLLAAALVLPGTATADPGRRATRTSTSQHVYGWRTDTATTTLSPLWLVAETGNPAHALKFLNKQDSAGEILMAGQDRFGQGRRLR